MWGIGSGGGVKLVTGVDEAPPAQAARSAAATRPVPKRTRDVKRPAYAAARSQPPGTGRTEQSRTSPSWSSQSGELRWASGGDAAQTAEYLGLRPDQVDTAAGYYADHGSEIDELIALNQEDARRGMDRAKLRKRVQRR